MENHGWTPCRDQCIVGYTVIKGCIFDYSSGVRKETEGLEVSIHQEHYHETVHPRTGCINKTETMVMSTDILICKAGNFTRWEQRSTGNY